MTAKRAASQCGKCGATLPRRPVSIKRDEPMVLFGMDVKATTRIYVCRDCGNRHAQVEAVY